MVVGVAVAKALGAGPVILIGTRDSRLEIGDWSRLHFK